MGEGRLSFPAFRTRFVPKSRLACVLSCAGFLAVSAQWLTAIQFDVFLAYDSYVPQASWFPIVCEVHNDVASFDGYIEVSSGSFQGATTRRVPIELPTGTTKRLTIPVFSEGGYGGSWNVRLLDDRGKMRAEQLNLRARSRVSADSILLGSLSRSGAWSPSFQEVKTRQPESSPVAARFQPAIFPDNPLVLEGLDAVYLNSERVLDLRPNQVTALRGWLAAGGHLIVAVENIADVNTTPWLRQLLPVELSGPRTIEAHSELQEWLRSAIDYGQTVPGPRRPPPPQDTGRGSPTLERPFADIPDDIEFEATAMQVVSMKPRDGRVLVTSEGAPLIVQASRGLGRTTVLAFSPEREPFRSWRSLPAFWSRLTEVPPQWYVSSDHFSRGGYGADGIFGAMIDSRQVRKLPIGWLLLLLVAYLLIIGPFDRWWLNKIGRPMLTWITFPAYVVLFSGLIYLIGYKLRAGEREWNELHVVDVLPIGAQAELRGRTYGSLYSPVNRTYEIEGPQSLAAFRGELNSGWGNPGSSERIDIWRQDENFRAEAYVPVWTSQLFVNDWWQSGSAPFSVEVSGFGAGLAVKVQNRLNHELSPVRLVLQGRVFDLGTLAPGGAISTSLNLAEGQDLRSFVGTLGSDYTQRVAQRRRAFGSMEGGRISDLPGGAFVTSFLRELHAHSEHNRFLAPAGLDLSETAQDKAILLAWASNEAPVGRMSRFSVGRGGVNTMWRLAVPLNPQP